MGKLQQNATQWNAKQSKATQYKNSEVAALVTVSCNHLRLVSWTVWQPQ